MRAHLGMAALSVDIVSYPCRPAPNTFHNRRVGHGVAVGEAGAAVRGEVGSHIPVYRSVPWQVPAMTRIVGKKKFDSVYPSGVVPSLASDKP